MAAIAGFGAVASGERRIYAAARSQAHDGTNCWKFRMSRLVGKLDEFLKRLWSGRATSWDLAAAFIALLEDGVFHVRVGADRGTSSHLDVVFPDGIATRALSGKEVSGRTMLRRFRARILRPREIQRKAGIGVPWSGRTAR